VYELKPQYARVISFTGDHPLFAHVRAQKRCGAILRESFSFQSDRVRVCHATSRLCILLNFEEKSSIQLNTKPSRFSHTGVGGGDARKMQGNFLVFAHASPRACPRRIGSHHHAIGAYEAVSSHHALRACDFSPHSDCFGKKFEFCSGDTAKFQNSFFRQNAERRKATRQEFPPESAKGF